MIKFFTKRMNNRKGFTLIELIVVIAILGILAAIAIPRLAGFRKSAALAADNATAAIIGKAAEALAASQNMNDDARGQVTIANLTDAELLVEDDLIPQHPDATGTDHEAWDLEYDEETSQFKVTLPGVDDVQYPAN